MHRLALTALLAVALSGPVLAQQGGPNGSAPGPIAPQLQAVQRSLLQADEQLSASRTGSQPPNFDQTLRAVQGAQDTLAELRRGQGGDTRVIQDAERELAATRRLLESPNPNLAQVSTQLRQAANALTTVGSATGATTGGTPAPGQPALGGSGR
jgi:hypothetical protein